MALIIKYEQFKRNKADASRKSFNQLKEESALATDHPKRDREDEELHLSSVRVINLDNDLPGQAMPDIRIISKPMSDRSDTSDRKIFNDSNNDNRRIYRIRPKSDTWACQECKFTGDIWFMQKHPCKGRK